MCLNTEGTKKKTKEKKKENKEKKAEGIRKKAANKSSSENGKTFWWLTVRDVEVHLTDGTYCTINNKPIKHLYVYIRLVLIWLYKWI